MCQLQRTDRRRPGPEDNASSDVETGFIHRELDTEVRNSNMWFGCHTSPIGAHVLTFASQRMALSGKVVERLGGRALLVELSSLERGLQGCETWTHFLFPLLFLTAEVMWPANHLLFLSLSLSCPGGTVTPQNVQPKYTLLNKLLSAVWSQQRATNTLSRECGGESDL